MMIVSKWKAFSFLVLHCMKLIDASTAASLEALSDSTLGMARRGSCACIKLPEERGSVASSRLQDGLLS